MSPLLRDLLAFLLGMAGVMTDFYGALDLKHGLILRGIGLVVLGLLAIWGSFQVAAPSPD